MNSNFVHININCIIYTQQRIRTCYGHLLYENILNLIGDVCVDINSNEKIISRLNHYIIDTN